VKHRFIAAVLLLNLVGWSNSAAFCLSGLGRMASQLTSALKTGHMTGPRLHACCPRPQSKPQSGNSAGSTPSVPDHRCCFVQNPQIPSSLHTKSRDLRTESVVGLLTVHSALTLRSIHAECTPVFRESSSFGTVLRI